jgi:hypothetical protein
MVRAARDAAVLALGLAVRSLGERLSEEQEVMARFADAAMEVYAVESALLRARKSASRTGAEGAELAGAVVRAYARRALARVESATGEILARLDAGPAARAALDRLVRRDAVDVIALRQTVAAAVLDAGGYPF